MAQFTPLIICNENNESNIVSSVLDFDNKEIDLFGFNHQQVLESIISNLLNNPQVLQTHIQRIYFCYQYDLADHLFAALVDFLIVLEGKGQQIQSRMVNGSKPKLHLSHYVILKNALKLSTHEVKLLKGNLYSVLTQGLIGVNVLIEKET